MISTPSESTELKWNSPSTSSNVPTAASTLATPTISTSASNNTIKGHGCVYTSTRRPLKLLHAEGFETRYEALTMERKLKGWSRAKKLAYMAADWNAVGALSKGKHKHQQLL